LGCGVPDSLQTAKHGKEKQLRRAV
jgi:hypothetical protein